MDQVSASPSIPQVGPPSVDFTSYIHAVAAYYPRTVLGLEHAFGLLIGLSFPLSVFFLVAIVYSVEQLKRIRRKEEQMYDLKVEQAYETVDSPDPALAHRWDNVTKHIDSPNQNDWKQAIIEADIILDEILTKMGYRGESIGEKLKRVSPGDFKSLDDAWEAHKVRNQIAHEPGYVLSQHEAKQVIGRFRKVFEEFFYI